MQLYAFNAVFCAIPISLLSKYIKLFLKRAKWRARLKLSLKKHSTNNVLDRVTSPPVQRGRTS